MPGLTQHQSLPAYRALFILSSFPRRRESIWSCHEKVAIGHGHVGPFILSSFPRRRESIWSCHEKVAIGHGHVGSPFLGKDETHLTQFGK